MFQPAEILRSRPANTEFIDEMILKRPMIISADNPLPVFIRNDMRTLGMSREEYFYLYERILHYNRHCCSLDHLPVSNMAKTQLRL
jgi:hypothetical protein